MNHYFDVEVATRYSVNIAIFLNNLAHWTVINIANRKNYYDFRYWTYNSRRAFLELFPYWTDDQLRTVISNAIKADLVIEGCYNAKGYDRTKWYSLTDKSLLIYKINPISPTDQELIKNTPLELPKSSPDSFGKNPNSTWGKSPMHWGKIPNALGENPQPIPNSIPDEKPNTTTTRDQILSKNLSPEPVVVSSLFLTSTPNPQTQVSEDRDIFISLEWDSKLRAAYNQRPTKTKNIFCDDDFLSACKYHAEHRPEGVSIRGRLNKLIEFTLSGMYEEPPEWAANIVKARNHRLAEENLKRNEANSEARVKEILKKSPLNLVGGRDAFRNIALSLKKEIEKEPCFAEKRSTTFKKIEPPKKQDEVIETDFMWEEG